jgi:hypothetical protein
LRVKPFKETIFLFLCLSAVLIFKVVRSFGGRPSCRLHVKWEEGQKNHIPSLSHKVSGFGGLEVAFWPLVLKFVGSNPAEAVGFLRVKKSSARLPSEGK